MKKPHWFLIGVCLFCACASSVKVLKPTGEAATLTLGNTSHAVELLAVSDSTIYVNNQNQIWRLPLSDVRKIHVQGYEISPAAKLIAIIPGLLIEGIVLGAAGSVDEGGWQFAAVAAMAGTVVASLTGNPKVNFSPPLKKEEVEMLRFYCRYPQGLNRAQWETLLRHFTQEEFKRQ